ncbi:BrxA family protein [Candidatus Bipolaricaulota bacterium]
MRTETIKSFLIQSGGMHTMELRDSSITARLAAQGAMLYELSVLARVVGDDRTRRAVRDAVIDRDVFVKASEGARKKVFLKLSTKYFRQDTPVLINQLLRSVQSSADQSEVALLAYATILWNDGLVFVLGTRWLAPKSGEHVSFSSDDVLGELRFLSKKDFPTLQTWSESTLIRVSRHYLGLLRDCGFAVGSAKKALRWPYVPPRVIHYIAQLVLGGGEPASGIPEHPMYRAMGLGVSAVVERLEEAGYVIQGGRVLLPAGGADG